ncbi:MAG: GNAT family N-acetyltransferase [Candidatus Thorarchaeota archaeon]|nr:GNAT family N-acetyltransferase [Candidatus Thorarchaeota archaeon]
MAIDEFDCGNDLVNGFLKEKAVDQQFRQLTKIYVICHEDRVIGYYAIACSSIRVKLPDMLKEFKVPSILLGMIGIDKQYQGKGISKVLIEHCISLSINVGKTIACRIVCVDALDTLVEYYKKMGFIEVRKIAGRNQHTMYLDLSAEL